MRLARAAAPVSGERRENRDAGQKAARSAADNLVQILAADLVAVFSIKAPEIDLIALGVTIANEGRRLEEQKASA